MEEEEDGDSPKTPARMDRALSPPVLCTTYPNSAVSGSHSGSGSVVPSWEGGEEGEGELGRTVGAIDSVVFVSVVVVVGVAGGGGGGPSVGVDVSPVLVGRSVAGRAVGPTVGNIVGIGIPVGPSVGSFVGP